MRIIKWKSFILSIMLAVFMAVACLAGCGKQAAWRMRIRSRPVASPPGRACGVFAGPAIGLPVSDGSIQTLRGGNRNRGFRRIWGNSGGMLENTNLHVPIGGDGKIGV